MHILCHRIMSFVFLLDTESSLMGFWLQKIALGFHRWTSILVFLVWNFTFGPSPFGFCLLAWPFGLLPLDLSPLALGFAFYPWGSLSFFPFGLCAFGPLLLLHPWPYWFAIAPVCSHDLRRFEPHVTWAHSRDRGLAVITAPKRSHPQPLRLYYWPRSIEGFQFKHQSNSGNGHFFSS